MFGMIPVSRYRHHKCMTNLWITRWQTVKNDVQLYLILVMLNSERHQKIMKKWRKYLQIIAASAVFVSVGGVWLLQNASAATGSIYLTPSPQSILNGSSFTLNL